MKFFDRLKLVGKKAEKKILKVTSTEELSFYINEKTKHLNEIRSNLMKLKAERDYNRKNKERLEQSLEKLHETAKRLVQDGEDKNKKLLQQAFEYIKSTETKINLIKSTEENFNILIEKTEKTVSVLSQELSSLKLRLEELQMKESFAKSFKAYNNLNLGEGIGSEKIEDLIKDVEVDYSITEMKLEEKTSSVESIDDFLRNTDNEYEKFIESLK